MSTPDPNYMRVSDHDREHVVAQLRAALNAGRMSLDEFDRRSGAAYAASTYGELNLVLADLPGTTAPEPPYHYHPYGLQTPPGYATPGHALPPMYYQAMPPRAENGFGVAGLVLGIVGICCCIAAILAIIFGAIGMSKANRGAATNKGMAIAGLTLGIIGAALSVIRIPMGWVF
ncbi:DUF1707 and DUF4190 domain-containing protein [Glycomyces tarimensis]